MEKKVSEDVVRFVLMTEKSVKIIETENKLVFVVGRESEKEDIKKSVEELFEKKVAGVKTLIDRKGRKKAFVRFVEPGAAGDIAIRLGII